MERFDGIEFLWMMSHARTMTGTQKYLFDLQGFLVVEDVLTDR